MLPSGSYFYAQMEGPAGQRNPTTYRLRPYLYFYGPHFGLQIDYFQVYGASRYCFIPDPDSVVYQRPPNIRKKEDLKEVSSSKNEERMGEYSQPSEEYREEDLAYLEAQYQAETTAQKEQAEQGGSNIHDRTSGNSLSEGRSAFVGSWFLLSQWRKWPTAMSAG